MAIIIMVASLAIVFFVLILRLIMRLSLARYCLSGFQKVSCQQQIEQEPREIKVKSTIVYNYLDLDLYLDNMPINLIADLFLASRPHMA
jgi:hypothetical protein